MGIAPDRGGIMNTGIKRIVRSAIRVVSPGAAAEAPARRSPRHTEQPVLGHRAGIDRREYGNPAFEACRNAENYTVRVDGREHRVFFFCGHPRSGTHWMDAVIKLHPKLWIDGEYRFESLHNSLNDLTGKSWHAASREPMRTQAVESFRRTIKEIIGSSSAHRPGAAWLGDRTPRPCRVLLPGAPQFLIIRDPRDILVSWAHQELKNGGFNYIDGGFAAELGESRAKFLADPDHFKKNPGELLGCERWLRRLAGRWRRHLRVDMECLKKIDAGLIEEVNPLADRPPMLWNWQSRVLVVRYENIHRDPEGERSRIYSFLGVNPAEAGPLSDETRTKPKLASENPHGLFRKGAVGDWVQYFTDDVKGWFKDEAGDTLIELGYEKDDNW
ncbi:MAG: sulfotransferase domain-containing protein [Phycisphaerales bacterium]|nr:sulfotransferase domain-containing protein [Phycisphaerales bacterium]